MGKWSLNSLFIAPLLLCLSPYHLNAQFFSPSDRQISQLSFDTIQKSLQLRKVNQLDKNFLTRITSEEQEGFLGYHGDSLDFYIFQDIIRLIIEKLLETTIRNDFHFLAPPLDPILTIQSKNELVETFLFSKNPGVSLYESTFPMNFSLWDNCHRLGLNSIEQFSKNEPVRPLGYQRRLRWFFKNLGIPTSEIAPLFKLAHQELNFAQGVILQIFDTSSQPYAFSSEIAYPAYPNGFIAENRTVDEYYMNEDIRQPYPHEVRLLLTNHQVLNPYCPLKIVRHLPLSSKMLATYQSTLKNAINRLLFNEHKAHLYRNELKKVWIPLKNHEH